MNEAGRYMWYGDFGHSAKRPSPGAKPSEPNRLTEVERVVHQGNRTYTRESDDQLRVPKRLIDKGLLTMYAAFQTSGEVSHGD